MNAPSETSVCARYGAGELGPNDVASLSFSRTITNTCLIGGSAADAFAAAPRSPTQARRTSTTAPDIFALPDRITRGSPLICAQRDANCLPPGTAVSQV